MSNSSGALSDTFVYGTNGWGEPSHASGTTNTNLRFTGREYDGSSNLYYLRARYYDPATGRFVSEDSLGFKAGEDFYAYVFNNPIMHTDPSGHDNPGCDGIPHKFETGCRLRCCAVHDECYDKNHCTATSWCFTLSQACAKCNHDVEWCFIQCKGDDGGGPKTPSCYNAKTHTFGPCPWEQDGLSPLPTPTPSPNNHSSLPKPGGHR